MASGTNRLTVVQRVVGVGLIEEHDEAVHHCVEVEDRLPVFAQDVQAHCSLPVNVGVVDGGRAPHLGWLVRVRLGNVHIELKAGGLPQPRVRRDRDQKVHAAPLVGPLDGSNFACVHVCYICGARVGGLEGGRGTGCSQPRICAPAFVTQRRPGNLPSGAQASSWMLGDSRGAVGAAAGPAAVAGRWSERLRREDELFPRRLAVHCTVASRLTMLHAPLSSRHLLRATLLGLAALADAEEGDAAARRLGRRA